MFTEKVVARFWGKVNKDGPIPEAYPTLGPCWIWKPRAASGGYGQMYVAGKMLYAHRVSYLIAFGSIPEGMVVDHRCEVRHCVRPDHLVAATQRDNVHRARAWEAGAQMQREKTECPNGHPYDKENTYVNVKRNRRACRTCGREASRNYKLNNPQPKRERVVKTHCKNGHEFTQENTRVANGNGQRICVECSRQRVRDYRGRQAAQSV